MLVLFYLHFHAPVKGDLYQVSAHQILHNSKKLPHKIIGLKINIRTGGNTAGIFKASMPGKHHPPKHMKIVGHNPHVLIRSADNFRAECNILGSVRGL